LKPKILFTSRQFHPVLGGTEIYMLECAKRLVERGYEVTVLTMDHNIYTGQKMPSMDVEQGIKIIRIPCLRIGPKFIPIGNLRALFRAHFDADIIHTHDIRFLFESQFLITKLLKKIFVVGTYGFILHQTKGMWWKLPYFHRVLIPLMKRSDAIHSISHQDSDQLAGRIENSLITLIEGGVDAQGFGTSTGKSTERDPNLFVLFGRLDRNKAIDDAIQALAKLPNACRLELIYGSYHQDYLDHLRLLARELGVEERIHWRGRVTRGELIAALHRCVFTLLPSRYEGFGLTTLEAMSAGVIPIANDIDAFKNVIDAGEDGMIVQFSNVDQSAAAIQYALSLSGVEIDRMRENTLKKAWSYDWSLKVDQLEQLYLKLFLPKARQA
jgi:alpha-1,3-mannosyltransferase